MQIELSGQSGLSEPLLIVGLVDLSEDISVNHSAGGSVKHTWGWVSSAWNLGLNGTLVGAEWDGNERSVSHGAVEASLVLISADDNDLNVLSTVGVPLVVKVCKVSLEWSTAGSPRSGVEDHNELVSGDGFSAEFLTVFVDELSSKEIHPKF